MTEIYEAGHYATRGQARPKVVAPTGQCVQECLCLNKGQANENPHCILFKKA
jgi:hypothetical protein